MNSKPNLEQCLDLGFVRLVSVTENPGHHVVNAARCSFGSSGDDLGERDRKLIKYLLGNGHTSPFRHTHFAFHIKAPLFVFRQWWKHQVDSSYREYESEDGGPIAFDIYSDTDKGCSWNELSGRYREMEPDYYTPANLRRATTGPNAQGSDEWEGDDYFEKSMMLESFDASLQTYRNLLDKGVAKELARMVLPSSIYSECYWTVSLQAVLHFLDQRLDPHAQWEMRQYAQGVLAVIREHLESMGLFTDGTTSL